MITLKPFRAVRPSAGWEENVACAPYDVMDSAQAAALAKDNPYSYLHVTRSEIDFPKDMDPYHQEVYDKAKENLEGLLAQGILQEDPRECYYLYRQVRHGHAQNGIVGCAAIDDYQGQEIKRHEWTRIDKEMDRINHFYTCNAQTEPVFLFYKKNEALDALGKDWMNNHAPIYDFEGEDGVRQMLWVVDEEPVLFEIQEAFGAMKSLYIADGHHRTASAVKVGLRKREENPGYTGEEAFNFFLSVVFPQDQLCILAYHRVVEDLGGMEKEAFLCAVKEKFIVKPCPHWEEPKQRATFTMVLRDQSYRLEPKEGLYDKQDPVERLDAAILQDHLLAPILKVNDPRTDGRIRFFGGEGVEQAMRAEMDAGSKVAFLLYPTQIEDITDVSDAGQVMPPKSTWFEPKLKSGLFLHRM